MFSEMEQRRNSPRGLRVWGVDGGGDQGGGSGGDQGGGSGDCGNTGDGGGDDDEYGVGAMKVGV